MTSNASSSPRTLASPTSPVKQSPTASTPTKRLPAPTLFVGPPSRNASQLSIARTATHDSAAKPLRDPLNRQKSALSRPAFPAVDGASSDRHAPKESTALPALKKKSDKSIEARWQEMQSTLNEVELTAQSSTHVFGETHARALDELRRAQVELARAWGRGHEDHHTTEQLGAEATIDHFKGADELARDRGNASRRRADTDASASTALSDESGPSDATSRGGKSQLEDETALDIRLASERRAANEAYFRKVDSSVRDVVAKLEVVAEAMRGVEGESRSLWSATEGSSTTSGSGEAGRAGKAAG